MANTISNILTINGTDKQVAEVREFIKGSNGESISLQSIWPMPKRLKGKRKVEVKCGSISIPVPDWVAWRVENWGTKSDAETINDEVVDALNRILFNTASCTPFSAMAILSFRFPKVTFHVTFSDGQPESFCGEYTLSNGEMTNVVISDSFEKSDVPIDQQMEYYFRTHEYDRENWKKNDSGEWINLYDEEEF